MNEILSRLRRTGPIEDAEMLDLDERDGRYYFCISGSELGFADALQAVKGCFLYGSERRYNPETHEWSVPATNEMENRLCVIFENAPNAFRVLHSQMEMF